MTENVFADLEDLLMPTENAHLVSLKHVPLAKMRSHAKIASQVIFYNKINVFQHAL
jgi:hypothetical protein